MKKVLLLVNPVAGKMRSKSELFGIIKTFNDADWDVWVKFTGKKGDATAISRRAAENNEVDVIACVGGDGTLNETITGLMQSGNKKIRLGYLPAGSTNDFANTLELPQNLSKATENIIKSKGYHIDVGHFNDKYFSYIASFGVFTSASYSVPQATKNVFGHLSYIIEGLKDIPNVREYHLVMTVDGDRIEGDYIFGAISNATAVGGIVKLREDLVDLSDGKFEITLVRNPENIIEFNSIISAVTVGDLSQSDNIDFIKGSKITVDFDSPMDWSLDGEHADGGKHVEISNLNHAYVLLK